MSHTLLRLALAAMCICPALLAESPAGAPSAQSGDRRDLLRQLRSDHMRPPTATQPDARLQAAVRALQGWRFPQKPPRPPADEPRTSTTQPRPTQISTTRPAGPLTPAVLTEIAKRPLKDMANPASLADALFLAGRARAAYAIYELALASEKSPSNRAWMLFQMGNCRREFDPAGSRPIYQRLLSEHPESPWVSVAQICDVLTEWYEINKPSELLTQTERSINSK